jgi:polynucleotide 5'-hydroxyl-kinase GRC3/NOL9
VYLVLGATDRGKTSVVTRLAREWSATARTAVIDADPGQSEIGPPGTVGLAWARPETTRLHDLTPLATYFVGALSPVFAALELTAAVAEALRRAVADDAERVLIDMPGFVAGPAGRRFLVQLTRATAPDTLLCVERGDELLGLRTVLVAATGARVEVMAPPEGVQRKSTALRTTRRLGRLAAALDGTQERELPLGSVATLGATLGSGTALAPHLVRWCATALRLPVVHAEVGDGALNVFVAGALPRPGWDAGAGPVADEFGARSVRALSLGLHTDVCLGVHESGGRLSGLGRFLRLDPDRGALVIAAPSRVRTERIGLLAFGRFRVAADGTVRGDVKPGEI